MTRANLILNDSCYTPSKVIKPYPFRVATPPMLPLSLEANDVVSSLRQQLSCPTSGVGHSGIEIWGRNDPNFEKNAVIFNGAIRTHAVVLARPTNAAEVSKIVLFCRERGLELSIKGGGFGTHGWSLAGLVVVDLTLINQVVVSPPDSAPTLQETFNKLSLSSDHLQRPSLAGSHGSAGAHGSAESGTFIYKRSAKDASIDGDVGGARGKRRTDSGSGSGSGGSSNSGRETDGDLLMDSASHDSHSRYHSSTSSESRNGSRGSESTAATSPFMDVDGPKLFNLAPDGSPLASSPSPLVSTSDSSNSSPTIPSNAPNRGPRTTYVNPAPTSSRAFPFIPSTSYGSSSSSSYPSTMEQNAISSHERALFNTNPDPPSYTLVTFGAGVHSKDLDKETGNSSYGAYHVPTSAFPVGAGQFISGGFGFMGRKHGLAMDNLVEAEVVLADGRIVWVGADGKRGGEWKDDEDSRELWWGLRGAGAILGVVTRFRAKAYYLPSVYAGNFIYKFDKATTPSLIRHIRDCIKGSPRTLYANIIMTAGPFGSPAIVVIQLCFSGSRSEGEMYVQAISAWEGGRCEFQQFSDRSFGEQQMAVERVLNGGHGRKWFIKSDMLKSLSDEVIDETCGRFHVVPDGCTWLFEFTGGGAVEDVKDTCFPSSHRESSFTVAALHQWGHSEGPMEDTLCVTTAEDWINQVIHPNSPG
ncbi:hypothetical protein P7C73_g6149, partial [Tremellales sp. Uapishka_1]